MLSQYSPGIYATVFRHFTNSLKIKLLFLPAPLILRYHRLSLLHLKPHPYLLVALALAVLFRELFLFDTHFEYFSDDAIQNLDLLPQFCYRRPLFEILIRGTC